MRRGRALKPHPKLRKLDDGRELVSRQVIARLLVVHEATVRRTLTPVACDVATHAYLYDAAHAKPRWPARDLSDLNL